MKKTVIVMLMTVAVLFSVALHSLAAVLKDPRALFEETCSQCHSIDIPKGEKMSKADWLDIVSRMRSNGLSISDAEAAVIVDYLSVTCAK